MLRPLIKTFMSEVLESRELSPHVKYCKLSVPDDFVFVAGQYVSVSVMVDGKKIRRPYSIATPPDKGYIELCVKRVERGPASQYIWDLQEGDSVELFGPLGTFVIDADSSSRDILFVCAGTGIGPFMSMIPFLLEKGRDTALHLIAGFRCEEEVLYQEELDALKKKYENFAYTIVLSQPSRDTFSYGYVQDFIPETVNGFVYICGLSEMIDSVRETLNERNVSEGNIFFEKYD